MYRTAQVTHGLATHQQVKQEVLTCSFTLKLHRNISITKYKLRLSPLKFYTCEIFKDFITAGSPISLNPSRPNISMHILHTGRRICLTIKGFLSCWSFLLLSWLICVICYMCYMCDFSDSQSLHRVKGLTAHNYSMACSILYHRYKSFLRRVFQSDSLLSEAEYWKGCLRSWCQRVWNMPNVFF